MNETRVYMINIDLIEDVVAADDYNNEEFIEEAEKQGYVYTLKKFEDAFNDSSGDYEVDTRKCYIRIIERKGEK